MKKLEKLANLYPHIGEASRAILERFKTSNKTCLIMPTGTGKTLTSSIVVKTLKIKTMYLCPNRYILRQTKRNYSKSGIDNVSFISYPNMISRIKSGDINYFANIDLFILDEFHRLGSEVWGNESWRKIMETFPESKILGLTATEFRFLDGCRDMSQELFNGDVAYKLTLFQCFRRGILKAPLYVIGTDITAEIPKLEERVEKLKDPEHKKKAKRMVKNLVSSWEKSKGIAGLYKEYILSRKNINKLMVFYEGIDRTKEMQDLVERTLREAEYKGNIKFYVANSDNDDSLEEVTMFNDEKFDGLKVMLSINMLNEGIHVDDCTAEVMYRSTTSGNIYYQQIGRVMSLSNKICPVILDLVQNLTLSQGVKEQLIECEERGENTENQEDGIEIVIPENEDQINKELNIPEDNKKKNKKEPEGIEIKDMTIDFQEACKMLDEERWNLKIKFEQIKKDFEKDGLSIFGL